MPFFFKYEDSVNQREELKQRKVLTGLRLKRAAVLITALSDEKERWLESVACLEKRLESLVGDTLVSASSVAYLGAFDTMYRGKLIDSWMNLCQDFKIPISKNYSLIKNMVTENQILLWQNEGVPLDSHSTENAIVMQHSRKWPLLIDPQGQAFK